MICVHKILIATSILFMTYAQDIKTSNKTVPASKTITSFSVNTDVVAEGGSLKSSFSNNVTSISASTTLSPVSSQHYGREHVTDKPASVEGAANLSKTVQGVKSTTETIIPISESISPEITSEKVDIKKTVPKKEATLPVLTTKSPALFVPSTTKATTTTVKPIPKKPLVTVGNDDEPFAPSHFVSSKSKNNSSIPKVPSIESYESKSKGGTDYIVPIVGVILSVPLVAIVLNAIYKRTKEWWHHRHYSRMDFLIDGMYNN